MPVRVCFDTSFLMLAAKFHLDVVSEVERLLQRRVEFIVLDIVVAELERLTSSRGRSGRDARVALELVAERKMRRIGTVKQSSADKALIAASADSDLIVATADLSLRSAIRDADKPVIFFREKAKLELDGIEAGYW